MRRLSVPPRHDWHAKVEALGFDFHSPGGEPYWDESSAWQFTAEEIDLLDDVAVQLHRMCLDAVAHVIDQGRWDDLAIPPGWIPLIRRSWQARDTTDRPLYGRLDIAWDGERPPKLLEYNADTPTALFEASVVQWHWLEAVCPGCDQFNGLHEALAARWAEIGADIPDGRLHLASMTPHPEDEGTVRYLEAVALEAGLAAKFVPIQEVGWNDALGFVDGQDQPIAALFKLYPWEWLLRDEFGPALMEEVAAGRIRLIEPAWKMLLASKGLLAILWELFSDHPNLLEAHLDRRRFAAGSTVAAKPFLGREGANISIARLGADGNPDGAPLAHLDGPYGAEGWVYQAFTPLASAGPDRHAVFGLWMVGDECKGMGIREDQGLVTRDTARFVPHFFR